MATLSTAIADARTIAYTDSNGISDANGITFANFALYDIQRKLIKRREDLFLQESKRDITSTQIVGGSAPGKFLFPTDMWLLKTIELNITDPTNQSLFLPVMPVELANLAQYQSFDWLRANQNSQFPLFDPHGDWFEIFPTPTVVPSGTGHIKILYYLAPTDFVATTDTINFPFSLDYRVLSYMIAAHYHRQNRNFDDEKEMLELALEAIDNIIKILATQTQQPTLSKGLPMTGGEF